MEIKLSVIIIAKNAAAILGETIKAIRKINDMEIIVVDDDSKDSTIQIAKSQKTQVITHAKKDFSEIRNFAAGRAAGEWIIYIDADEHVSAALAEEINQFLKGNHQTIGAVSLVRENFYLGKKWPKKERIVRMFRKKSLKGWQGELHESAFYQGEVYQLKKPLLHYTHSSLEAMVDKTVHWSGIEANLRFNKNHPPMSWWRFPRVMFPVFVTYYIYEGGWKVGVIGLIESIYQAFSIFITYARLWEMQNKKI